MSDLRNARRLFEQKRKEQEAAAAELRRLEAEPKLEIFDTEMIRDEKICEVLASYRKDEVRVLAKTFVENFEDILAKSMPEIEKLRQMKAEKQARRKARMQQQNDEVNDEAYEEAVSETYVDTNVESEEAMIPVYGGNTMYENR